MRKQRGIHLFIRQVTYGFSYGKYKYIVFFLLICLLAFMKGLQIKSIHGNSIGTFLLLCEDNGYLKLYQIPVNWILIQVFVLFLIADFLYQDAEKNRIYLLMRIRSRLVYITSTLCWIVFQTVMIFLGLFLLVYVVSSLVVGDFSLGNSPYFSNFILPLIAVKATPIEVVVRLFADFILTTIVLSSLQLLFMQFFSPILTFFGIIILCAISTFSGLKWLPAIHSMILKTDLFNAEHHLTFLFTLLYSVILFTVVSIVTLFIFNKKDIL